MKNGLKIMNTKNFFPEKKMTTDKKSSLKILLILLSLLLITACGSKKSPIGGPIDNEKPQILNISPAQFEAIENNEINISFSKLMDQNSVIAGITFYPPIQNKKFIWKKNILSIRINEVLKTDTNYMLSFNHNLKCYHGNQLEKPETFIFSSGKLNTYSLRGSFTYEDQKDYDKIKTIILLDKDSLMVLEKNIADNNFIIDYLNAQDMTIRAYIDKNNNKRYDYQSEPFFQKFLPKDFASAIPVQLTYQDTVKPDIKQIKAISKNDIVLTFNKPLHHIPYIAFVDEKKTTSLNISASVLDKNTIHCITSEQDTIRYKVYLKDIHDLKGNVNQEINTFINGSQILLTKNPEIISASIRNGTAISESQPVITIEFSEIFLKNNVKYSLKEIESNQMIPVNIIQDNHKIWKFKPAVPLKKFNSYLFVIDKSSVNHHQVSLKKELEIQFLVKDNKK